METQKKTVELEPGEIVYQESEIEALFKQRDDAMVEANKQRAIIRGLYADVKKVYNLMPMEGGKVNQFKMMGAVTGLMNNPAALDSFGNLGKFVEEFEKSNLVVIETKK